jgi:hypothetical protein
MRGGGFCTFLARTNLALRACSLPLIAYLEPQFNPLAMYKIQVFLLLLMWG